MRKKPVLIILALLVLIGGGLAVWHFTRPTLEQTFAEAEAAEKAARAKAATAAKPEDVKPDFQKTLELYAKVRAFGKSDKHAEALSRTGKIQQEDIKDDDAALKTFDDLSATYPADEPRTGDGMIRAAAILRSQGHKLAMDKKDADAKKKFEEALAKLEGYRKAFAEGPRRDFTLLTTGNIKKEDLKVPPAESIEPYKELVKDFPKSEYKPEAMYHIGELLEQMGKSDEALRVYGELSEEFPNSEWSRKAQLARGKILMQKEDEQEKAAEELKRLAEKFPDTDEGAEAGKLAEGATESAAKSAAGKSAGGRYGAIPVDTGYGAPPWEELKRFAEQKLDAKLYTMEVDFTPADHKMAVKGTVTITNNGADKDRQILFMLGNGFDIGKLTIDGKPATFEHPGDLLQVAVADPIKTGQTFTLGFEYTGEFAGPISEHDGDIAKVLKGGGPVDTPEDLKEAAKRALREAAKGAGGGGGGSGTASGSGPSGAASGPATATAPKPAKKRPMNLQIALGDDGFALSGAGWYPITVIGDLFNAKVTYHVPPPMSVAATGAEDASPRSGGKPGEFVFSTRRETFGLYFAYGNYEVREEPRGPVKYVTYLKPANAAKSSAYVDVASRILNFYGDKFVTFPYEKMAIVETPLPPILGGVGPSSMMLLSAKMVDQKDPPEWLLAHELAHQWFGNLVPINITDQGYSQWLSEGFATYCDALYTEHREGQKSLVEQVTRYKNTYNQITAKFPKKPTVRTCAQSSPMYRPVVYEKGAMVLHALRKVVGEQKFFALMKKYVETYADKPSVVGDFEKLAAETYGQPLDWFFKQWLDEATVATWVIRDVAAEANPDGNGYKVTVKVEQRKELIRMPVDVTLTGEKGEKKVVPNIEIKDKEQTLAFPCEFKPVKVVLDEDNWVLHSPGSGNTWPRESASRPTTGPASAPAPASGPATTRAAAAVETAPAVK